MCTNSPWTVQINAWLVAMRATGRPETTLRTRSEHLRWLAVWAGDRDPWSLTTDDLLTWMGGKVWARETRRGVRSSLRGFYRWGVATGRASHNPAEGLPSIPPSQPRPHPTPDRAYRMAVMAAGVRERLMLRLAAECGLRRAEVAQVHSRDLVEDLGGWSLVVHGKGARERVVPLPASLARELRLLGAGYAFPGDDHGHLSPRWVGKLVGRLLPEGYTMHSLRHRFATKAYAVSSDMFTVQELLGHASPVTTRVYVALPDDAKRRLVLAVANEPIPDAPTTTRARVS
ncbi:tyrosine-type recombinase/integrase [Cellulosimicrobium cellulans]|uniref:tyrosine-type recombinase/integrase n=1 Tax=Cellulosimicrobium cellulans TaxID=1710 RepID=UPI003665AEDB